MLKFAKLTIVNQSENTTFPRPDAFGVRAGSFEKRKPMTSSNVQYKEELDTYEELNREIETYWDTRSHDFSKVRQKELAGPSAKAWSQLLQAKLPQAKKLRILDIGTGAGFFAILLGRLGHDVTGIDMSGEMLHEAKLNALAYGVPAKFQKMNAQELDFASASFDVVISRNLTWTLPDVMAAYQEWHRVLKPDGLLLNFDSDYGLETSPKKRSRKTSMQVSNRTSSTPATTSKKPCRSVSTAVRTGMRPICRAWAWRFR